MSEDPRRIKRSGLLVMASVYGERAVSASGQDGPLTGCTSDFSSDRFLCSREQRAEPPQAALMAVHSQKTVAGCVLLQNVEVQSFEIEQVDVWS